MKPAVAAVDLLVRVCRVSGRSLALLLTGILLSVGIQAVPSATAVDAPPSLDLVPGEGQTGTRVTWVASGFAGCKPLGGEGPEGGPGPTDPDPEEPFVEGDPDGEPVPEEEVAPNAVPLLVAPLDEAGPVREVELLWDERDVLATAQVVDGVATSTIDVPESAKPGVHRVSARCVGVADVARSLFTVTDPQPPVEQILVPDVVGERLEVAEQILGDGGLELGERTGEGELVESQLPEAGELVDPGTRVDVDMGAAKPTLVVVPKLIDGSVADAKEALAARGLHLGKVVGDPDGIVRKQRPRPGKNVAPGTVVRITMVAAPVELVKVPDLVGESSSEADAALAAAGLVLGGADGDREIDSQDPVAGSLVPVGSTVRVTYAAVPSARTPLVAVLAAILLGSAAAAAGLRSLKRRLDKRWVRLHDVRAETGTAPAPVETTERIEDDSSPTLAVRIEPHRDGGTHLLEELNR